MGSSHDHERQDTGEPIVRRTRAASVFVAAIVAFALLLVLMVFVLQNGADVELELFWLDAELPLGVAMLLSALTGGLVVAAAGIARVLQLRAAARRHQATEQLSR